LLQQGLLQMSWEQVNQAYTRLFTRVIEFVPAIIGALVVIIITSIISRFVWRTVNTAMERTSADKNVRFLVARSGSICVWLVGFAVMLSVLEVNMAGIFAALGITGAAIGFALRDIIANFVAGVVLLSIRPFKLGDTISIDTFEGVVERIEIRVTVLRTSDGKEVSLPNSKVFSSVIVNHTTQHVRRFSFSIGVGYDTEFNRVQEILLEAVKKVAGVAAAPPPEVNIGGFSANFINIDINCWVESGANSAAVASRVRLSIKEALQEADISIAPAASMVLLQSGVGIKETVSATKRREK
jgi:small conductance mechanosensitive channel